MGPRPWGTDPTSTLTGEGRAAVFIPVDHCSGECLGIHAAHRATRFEALEPLRQAVRHSFGAFGKVVGQGTRLRHDHGSQFVADDDQNELAFLGLASSSDRRMLLRLARAMVGLYCASFGRVPKRITLDIDDTVDAVHGGQQLRLFNAHDDDDGCQPIVVLDGAGRFVAAVLRPARRPKGRAIAAHLRRLIRESRSHWPRVEILLRGDSHSCAPEVLDFCRARGVDFVLGLASNANLRRRTATLEQSTIARVDQHSGRKVRRSRNFTTLPQHGGGSSV